MFIYHNLSINQYLSTNRYLIYITKNKTIAIYISLFITMVISLIILFYGVNDKAFNIFVDLLINPEFWFAPRKIPAAL